MCSCGAGVFGGSNASIKPAQPEAGPLYLEGPSAIKVETGRYLPRAGSR